MKYNEAKPHEKFSEEIENFTNSSQFCIKINESIIKSLFFNIRTCIAAYLILKSYLKLNIDRISELMAKQNQDETEMLHEIDEKDYICLRLLGVGSSFSVYLNYHIKKEKLFVIKTSICESEEEKVKLIERINTNCPQLNHPFIPKFYGKVKNTQDLAMEFIYGQGLNSININELTDREILKILYELILAIEYLHKNQFIFRDLNTNNVIIDQNKNAIIIDFDRMIKYGDIKNDGNQTNLFPFSTAPEVNFGIFSYKCDVYSLGYIMKYMISNRLQQNEVYSKLRKIYEKCLDENLDKRPTISELIENFINVIFLFNLSSQNDPESQYKLGLIYYNGEYTQRDINKSIHYLTLAANQNDPEAQYLLGSIYYNGKYISRDIDKSIHYFTLAANQKHEIAQFQLGLIYYEGEYITRNINKSIQYFSLAANQNHKFAQINLGSIYYEGKYVKRDINKSIHYFALAANQNDPMAQYVLGTIYYGGIYIQRDIDKAIHYFQLSANQNHAISQFNLGKIYFDGNYISQDINKAIHYFSLAANQKYLKAQFQLGLISINLFVIFHLLLNLIIQRHNLISAIFIIQANIFRAILINLFIIIHLLLTKIIQIHNINLDLFIIKVNISHEISINQFIIFRLLPN